MTSDWVMEGSKMVGALRQVLHRMYEEPDLEGSAA